MKLHSYSISNNWKEVKSEDEARKKAAAAAARRLGDKVAQDTADDFDQDEVRKKKSGRGDLKKIISIVLIVIVVIGILVLILLLAGIYFFVYVIVRSWTLINSLYHYINAENDLTV